ncbi:hypothetical protein ACFXGT_38870 [Streptomyces sp. NPDC059352]|uniref:hypothetical protein n=1 Tax=Streptomyces sp. NPDC059352 TaxID=3346810 RepID=UPI0036BFA460
MTIALRTSVGALAICALSFIVATVRRDDADWLVPALWVVWPTWTVLVAGTVWLIRRQA